MLVIQRSQQQDLLPNTPEIEYAYETYATLTLTQSKSTPHPTQQATIYKHLFKDQLSPIWSFIQAQKHSMNIEKCKTLDCQCEEVNP